MAARSQSSPPRYSSSSSSSSWSGFFMGSAVTAVTILLYQNRTSLIHLLRELRDENEEEEHASQTPVATKTTSRSLSHLDNKSSKALVMHEDEQIGFLADIVKQLWPYINIAASDTIRATAEPIFKEMAVPLLRTMHFTKIDLGTVPIRLDNVRVHDVDLESNTLAFDVDVIWDGNCDMKLKADLIGSFGVKSIKMRGRMSILMRPLAPTTSIVKAIQYGFINTPELSLKYTGIAHVAELELIDQTIKDVLKKTINSMMVLPRRRIFKMDKACDFTHIFKPPIGILRVIGMEGRGFMVERGLLVDDVPDCYCVVEMGDTKHRTHTVNDNLSPVWNETMDFVLSDHDQRLNIQCWDHDSAPLDTDDDLGTASTSPGEIILAGYKLELPLQRDHMPNGAYVTLSAEVLNFTTNLHSLSATPTPSSSKDDKRICGLLTIFVLRAFDIPLTKEEAATSVHVTFETSKFATNSVVDYPGVDCLNPWYDKAFLVHLTPSLVNNGKIPSIRFDLMNGPNNVLGTVAVTHDEIVSAKEHTLAETRFVGKKGAKIQFQICLQGIESTKPLHGDSWETSSDLLSGSYVSDIHPSGSTSPIPTGLRGTKPSPLDAVMNSPAKIPTTESIAANRGGFFSEALQESAEAFDESRPASADQSHVRITIVGGKGFRVRRTAFFLADDVPDVYLNVTFGSSPQVWRTKTVHNSLAPTWNESKDYVLHSHGQIISIDVFDKAEGQKDKTHDMYIGSVRVTVGKVLLAGGVAEKEVLSEGNPTGVLITIQCQLPK
ncbi:hypothetical protein ACA910_018144 [Epithemia clementina (nom. ined.)]